MGKSIELIDHLKEVKSTALDGAHCPTLYCSQHSLVVLTVMTIT